eukprot:scaffold1309_cov117-Isochrysis_galbana.AAC.22
MARRGSLEVGHPVVARQPRCLRLEVRREAGQAAEALVEGAQRRELAQGRRQRRVRRHELVLIQHLPHVEVTRRRPAAGEEGLLSEESVELVVVRARDGP